MLHRLIAIAMLVTGLALPSLAASDRENDVSRINASARVFREIMNTPDNSIPQDLLGSAKCIAIIPGEKKAAFIFGGSYGKGLATCRTTDGGWSAPLFLTIWRRKLGPADWRLLN